MGLLTNNSSGGGPFYPSEISSTNLKIASVTFAALPSAATSTGKIYLVSDAGPAPGMYMVSNGTIWRPLGGRQVLASRGNNPVTVQSLAGAVAETIGPFPGGLVRAGMRLEADVQVKHAAIASGAASTYRLFIGNTLPIPVAANTTVVAYNTTVGINTPEGRSAGLVNVRSDTNSPNHRSGVTGIESFTSPGGAQDLIVDFSLPWYCQVQMISAAETAVAISTATWVGGVATYNTSAVHTLAVGDKTTIAGVDLAGYNGVVIVASVVDTDTFTVAMASDPGGAGTGGTSSRISNMVSQSYVLELVG